MLMKKINERRKAKKTEQSLDISQPSSSHGYSSSSGMDLAPVEENDRKLHSMSSSDESDEEDVPPTNTQIPSLTDPKPAKRLHLRQSHLDGESFCDPVDSSNRTILFSSTHLTDLQQDIVACKECYGDITITHHGRGFGQFAVWKCNDCQSRYVTKHCKVGTQYAPDLSTVYTSLINDDGYNGYQRYCGALHMPSMCKAVYYQHTQSLYNKMHDHYNELITIIHDRIRRYYREKLGVTPEDGILALEVSFDGSYAKRGYKSQYCLGIVIEVYTGWIVDFSVMSKCRLCKDTGLVECPHGEHIGSSGSMEPKIAKILWDRSRTIGFEYKVMVADGDSATYMIIKDTYGPNSVVKEDCINHVGKRMTSRLMTLRDSYTENVRTKSGMNSKLWSKVQKHKYHGKSRLLFLAQTTALDHNWGYEKASLLNRLSVGGPNKQPASQPACNEQAGSHQGIYHYHHHHHVIKEK